jgi:DNA-directed RNA polymerase specialized sigma24 family protein
MTTTAPAEAPFHPPATLIAAPSTRRLLARYVARRVPACDVEDVVQATLCDALSSGRAPREARDFQRWLLAIARFKVVDAHRAAARAAPGEPGELPAPAPPVEALSLLRWAERQLPRGAATEATVRWMVREADGDKLEAIAADEALPAERVRQRVSRLRRWMRERWVAEIAAAVALTALVVSVVAATRRHEAILPEIAADVAPADARLLGTWKLLSFTPSSPLSSPHRALVDRLAPSLTVTFDGTTFRASAAEGGFARSYAAIAAGRGLVEAVETTGEGRRASATYAWEGRDLVVTVPRGKWAGVARFRPVP